MTSIFRPSQWKLWNSKGHPQGEESSPHGSGHGPDNCSELVAAGANADDSAGSNWLVDRISERAYYQWLSEGCPEGRANEHWFAAERDILENL